jgi:hypothetical protein
VVELVRADADRAAVAAFAQIRDLLGELPTERLTVAQVAAAHRIASDAADHLGGEGAVEALQKIYDWCHMAGDGMAGKISDEALRALGIDPDAGGSR